MAWHFSFSHFFKQLTDAVVRWHGLCFRMKPENQQQFADQMLKADYHGANVVVVQSKCPSLIGKTGIILQETKNVFKIITTEHEIKGLDLL